MLNEYSNSKELLSSQKREELIAILKKDSIYKTADLSRLKFYTNKLSVKKMPYHPNLGDWWQFNTGGARIVVYDYILEELQNFIESVK